MSSSRVDDPGPRVGHVCPLDKKSMLRVCQVFTVDKEFALRLKPAVDEFVAPLLGQIRTELKRGGHQ
jgi:hypothetical protein